MRPTPSTLSSQVNFKWSGVDQTGADWPTATSTQKTLLVPGPVQVHNGDKHAVTLSAWIEGAQGTSSTATVNLRAVGSPLVAVLKGPSDFKQAATIVLNAANSYDPDGVFLKEFGRRLSGRGGRGGAGSGWALPSPISGIIHGQVVVVHSTVLIAPTRSCPSCFLKRAASPSPSCPSPHPPHRQARHRAPQFLLGLQQR